MQIQIEKTLDVEVVEHQFAELWNQTSGGVGPEDEFAVLRARVANLLVYVASESIRTEVNEIIAELTAIHPSRVLLMLGEKKTSDRDIEMSLETFCQVDKRTGAKRLSCEEVTLQAWGKFVGELPSAALPLLVPDLTTFLWWRDALASDEERPDRVFDALLRATDRLVVDSAEFVDPQSDLIAITKLFNEANYAQVGISDINWARLTSWRALLAGFYDVAVYQPLLERIDRVRIDYVAPEHSPAAVAPQALLIAGWLASRLGWTLAEDQPLRQEDETIICKFFGGERGGSPTVREGLDETAIKVELNRVERAEGKPGRLVQVELQSNTRQPASFAVSRSADNLHLTTECRVDANVHRGRVVPVRNRSAAQLLAREMEILCNDQIYQEALAVASTLIAHAKDTSPFSDL